MCCHKCFSHWLPSQIYVYLFTKILASMTHTLCPARESDITRVILFLFNMHSYKCQLLQRCRHLRHSTQNSLKEKQELQIRGQQQERRIKHTHLSPSRYCTSISRRASRATVWLVGCFHWFSCFFCRSIQLWRRCRRLSRSAHVWCICSASRVWEDKAKRWLIHV